MRGVRTPFVIAGCAGFLSGVAAGSLFFSFGIVLSWTFVIAGMAILLIGAFEYHGRHRVVALIAVVALGLGIVRFTVIVSGGVQMAPFPDRTEIIVSGYVDRVGSRTGRTVMRLTRTIGQMSARSAGRLDGEGLTTAFRYPIELVVPPAARTMQYGDALEATCSFHPPQRSADALTTSGTCVVYASQNIRVVSRGNGSPTIDMLLGIRDRLTGIVGQYLMEPAASIVNGILLGVDHGLPYDLTEAFRRSGTIHILVVSGWHMSFIGIMLRNWLLRRGWIPREIALFLAFGGVVAFAIMTGLAPSAVRGAIMVAALIAVDLLGRVVSPVRALLLTAVAMVAVQPHILGYDLGFQLSFAATAGLFLLEPIIRRWCTIVSVARAWSRWHAAHPRAAVVRSWGDEAFALFTASAAASLATALILMGSFGSLALLAPIVNIPVLLLVPSLMYVGMGFVTAALLIHPVAVVLGCILTAFSDALVAIVTFAGNLPWSAMATVRFDGWFTAGLYACAGVAVFSWYRRRGIKLLSPFPWERIGAVSSPTPVPNNSRPRQIGYSEAGMVS